MVNKYQKHKDSEKKPMKDMKIFLKKRKIKDEKRLKNDIKILLKKKKKKKSVSIVGRSYLSIEEIII